MIKDDGNEGLLADRLEAALKRHRSAEPGELRHAYAQLADILFGHVEPIIAALRAERPNSEDNPK